MIRAEGRPANTEPVCKKIQNYIFKFSDMLGQGNFSKVYRAYHEITSTRDLLRRRISSDKNYITKLAEVAET